MPYKYYDCELCGYGEGRGYPRINGVEVCGNCKIPASSMENSFCPVCGAKVDFYPWVHLRDFHRWESVEGVYRRGFRIVRFSYVTPKKNLIHE